MQGGCQCAAIGEARIGAFFVHACACPCKHGGLQQPGGIAHQKIGINIKEIERAFHGRHKAATQSRESVFRAKNAFALLDVAAKF